MIVPGRDDELCLAAGLFKLAEMVGPGFCPRVWMIDDAQVGVVVLAFNCCYHAGTFCLPQ